VYVRRCTYSVDEFPHSDELLFEFTQRPDAAHVVLGVNDLDDVRGLGLFTGLFEHLTVTHTHQLIALLLVTIHTQFTHTYVRKQSTLYPASPTGRGGGDNTRVKN